MNIKAIKSKQVKSEDDMNFRMNMFKGYVSTQE